MDESTYRARRAPSLHRLVIGLIAGLALGGASSAKQAHAEPPVTDPPRSERPSQAASSLRAAEAAFAEGALRDALDRANEAMLFGQQETSPLAVAAARLVRANIHLALGDAALAVDDLNDVIEAAAAGASADLEMTARLNRARAYENLGQIDFARGDLDRVLEDARALERSGLERRARVNRLRLDVDHALSPPPGEWEAATEALRSMPPGATRATLAIHLGESQRRAIALGFGDRTTSLTRADGLLRDALSQADEIEVPATAARIRASALGHLAALYAETGRTDEALVLTQRALLQASRSEYGAERFPWHLQSARLRVAAGDRAGAIRDYRSALEVLEANRGAITRSHRLHKAGTGPASDLSLIYREYVDLLLRRARQASDPAVRRKDLLAAQSALERFKSDELRNYFEDDCVVRYRERVTSVSGGGFDAVIVYPFVLEGRLELLVSVGAELEQVVVDVTRKDLREQVRQFRHLLEKRTTRQYLRPAQQLYRWLIEPIDGLLARGPVRTLVFVPDGILRTIPMAALHDGEKFLVERFPLGLTPGLELTDPSPFDATEQLALVAGVSESVQGFSALPNVEREIDSVHEVLGGERLLNDGFSEAKLTERIRNRSFGVIHIASHAQFNQTAAGGFMLAHDGRISFDELADALGTARYRENPLELVILSACETADGNERAALGLSGVAVKAGARSALGTLWQVSDEATAEFMLRFYGALREPGRSRAEAVREGQIRLLRDRAFSHPYYWSPFLLINSWL